MPTIDMWRTWRQLDDAQRLALIEKWRERRLPLKPTEPKPEDLADGRMERE